jgi:hypothetical protein
MTVRFGENPAAVSSETAESSAMLWFPLNRRQVEKEVRVVSVPRILAVCNSAAPDPSFGVYMAGERWVCPALDSFLWNWNWDGVLMCHEN